MKLPERERRALLESAGRLIDYVRGTVHFNPYQDHGVYEVRYEDCILNLQWTNKGPGYYFWTLHLRWPVGTTPGLFGASIEWASILIAVSRPKQETPPDMIFGQVYGERAMAILDDYLKTCAVEKEVR